MWVPVHARAAGHADRDLGSSTAVDTVFRLASLTKPMTSVAAWALVERGWLALDGSIRKFLPGFSPRLVNGTAPDIRVRHLLTHTAGFGYSTLPPGDR
jgi:CubicO group peptidase (beta-lactamase class C family)